MQTADYVNRYLFEPLGVAPHRNYYAKTADFSFSPVPCTDAAGVGEPLLLNKYVL